MIKDKTTNLFCAVSKIIGNDNQLTATLSSSDWKFFELGSKVKVISAKGEEFYRRIKEIGNGKQRNISIPKEEWDSFKKGDQIKIFPEQQPKVSKSQDYSMDTTKDDKQIKDKFS